MKKTQLPKNIKHVLQFLEYLPKVQGNEMQLRDADSTRRHLAMRRVMHKVQTGPELHSQSV